MSGRADTPIRCRHGLMKFGCEGCEFWTFQGCKKDLDHAEAHRHDNEY